MRLLAFFVAAFTTSPLAAQDFPLGPRSDFGRVTLNQTQSAGGVTLEQIIGGQFDSEPAYQYPEVSGYRRMGRAVGRLDVLTDQGTGHCTGFLIDDQHLMTNGHCLMIEGAQVQAVNFIAGYVETGISTGTQIYSVNPIAVEISAPDELDFAILEVFGNPAKDWGTLELNRFKFDADQHAGLPLIVIGHPAKMAQHISRKECRAAARTPLSEGRLRHTCDTLVGNSGSPVISEDARTVIALHHAGDAVNGVNFAVPIEDIAKSSPIVAALTAPPKTPEPTPPLATEPADVPEATAEAKTETRAVFRDWELRCLTTEPETCQIYQLLRLADGTAVAEVSGFRVEGTAARAGFTIVTPTETLLSKGLTMKIDQHPSLKYDFSFCNDVGCYARIGVDQTTLSQMQKGIAATLLMYPALAPDTEVRLEMSLLGFSDALEASSLVSR